MTSHSLSLTHLAQPPRQLSSGKPPLLLLLHSVGSHEQDLFGLAPALDPRFFVVSARGPVTLGPGAFGWYRVQWTDAGPQHVPAEAEAGRVAASHFIKEAVAAYGLDARRVYVMGFSQGAITSLSLALTEPHKTAAVVVMSGRLLSEVAAHIHGQGLVDYPFFVAYGTQDTVLPIMYGPKAWTTAPRG